MTETYIYLQYESHSSCVTTRISSTVILVRYNITRRVGNKKDSKGMEAMAGMTTFGKYDAVCFDLALPLEVNFPAEYVMCTSRIQALLFLLFCFQHV